tara:strand:- start:1460 stop:2014 length:555 start_codon:yes stop_codon:yes gene_type:complete
MNRWSNQITMNVNRAISQGRRAMGKGSRQTTYQNIFRTKRQQILGEAAYLRAVFRNSNTRSRAEVSTQAKWFLMDSQKAVATNHLRFQAFTAILKEKGITQAQLEEFIVFLLGNHEFTAMINTENATKKSTEAVVSKPEADASEEDEFGAWNTGAAAVEGSLDESDWGSAMADAGSFSDEEDEM